MDSGEHTELLGLERAVLADVAQYAACPLTDKPRIQQLNTSIQDKLSKIRALTRDLELFAEEADSDEEQQQVAALLSAHVAEYDRVQQALKAAAAAQRQAAAQTAAQERQELLGGPEGAARRRQMHTDADMVSASQGITDSLRRARQVMAEELEHTSATLAALDASHEQLGSTQREYAGQHGLLGASKGLLRTLDWQNRAETYMLWMGLALFALVAAYIVQKRAMHFVPRALRPSALLGSATSLVRGKPAATAAPPPPPPPLPQPQPSKRTAPVGGHVGAPASAAPPRQDGLPPHFVERETKQAAAAAADAGPGAGAAGGGGVEAEQAAPLHGLDGLEAGGDALPRKQEL